MNHSETFSALFKGTKPNALVLTSSFPRKWAVVDWTDLASRILGWIALRLLCHGDEWAQHRVISPHINLIFHSVPLNTGLSDLSLFLSVRLSPCSVNNRSLTYHLLLLQLVALYLQDAVTEALWDTEIHMTGEKMVRLVRVRSKETGQGSRADVH